jgi:hypothetical protein
MKYDGVLRLLACGLLASALPPATVAQEKPHPLQVALGAVRTAAERSALAIAIDFTKNVSGVDFQFNQKNSFVFFTPDIQIQTGEDDAFDGIVAKVTGSLVVFNVTDVGGIKTPNTAFFHAFPFSAGMETDRRFDAINALAEVGYVPWFQGAVPRVLKSTFVGVFLQGGYKAKVGDPEEVAPVDAGNVDESDEAVESGLLRLKGSLKASPTISLGKDGQLKIGLVGAAHVWYDLANNATYHRVDAKFKLDLGKDRSFEFGYQDGSGAPNFNEGDQFGAFMVIAF